MLSWRKVGSIWFGNGFKIERAEPAHWVLDEVTTPESDLVLSDPEPLADLPTLHAARYTAEMLHTQRELSKVRKRLAIVAVAAFSLAALFASSPLTAIAAGVVGTGALLELTMTWLAPRTGRLSEFVQ